MRRRKTRRDSRIWAVEDALFEGGQGGAQQVAQRANCSLSTAYRHLNGLIRDGLAEWSRLFLHGRKGYVGSPRCYRLSKRGYEVVGAMRLLRDEVRYWLYPPEPISCPEEFEGIENLITTGYMQVGATR